MSSGCSLRRVLMLCGIQQQICAGLLIRSAKRPSCQTGCAPRQKGTHTHAHTYINRSPKLTGIAPPCVFFGTYERIALSAGWWCCCRLLSAAYRQSSQTWHEINFFSRTLRPAAAANWCACSLVAPAHNGTKRKYYMKYNDPPHPSRQASTAKSSRLV